MTVTAVTAVYDFEDSIWSEGCSEQEVQAQRSGENLVMPQRR